MRLMPAGRSLITVSRLSSLPVVMLNGPPDEARINGVNRNPCGRLIDPRIFKKCRRSVKAGPHSGCKS